MKSFLQCIIFLSYKMRADYHLLHSRCNFAPGIKRKQQLKGKEHKGRLELDLKRGLLSESVSAVRFLDFQGDE